MINTGRRRTLGLLGALGSTTLAGCCLPSQFRRSDIVDGLAFADGPPLLGASKARPAARLPFRAIDTHAHFFNASDAAVTGYLVHSIGHTQSPAIRRLLAAMQGVLNALVKIAPTAADEYAQLVDLNKMSLAGRDQALADAIGKRKDLIVEALLKEMRRQGADRAYLDALREVQRNAADASVPGQLTEDMLQRALEFDPGRESLAFASGEHPDGVLQFLRCMLQERWMSLALFRDGYEGAGVEAAFGALVDFDHWYKCAGRSSLRDQVKLHALISCLSGGYLMPLVAYNPWTDLVEDGAALELVRSAVEDYGFVGVKIYPPVGFLPYGNAGADNLPVIRNGPDRAALDRRLEALFTWCARNDVPVMAHGNSTMGRDNRGDELGGPDGWGNVVRLLRGKGLSPPVNIGHFGGDSEAGQDWPSGFAGLMASEGGERIYADIGYWSALPRCRPEDATCLPLARLDGALRAYPGLGKRLMYGSDWFMYVKQAGWWEFPHQVAAALQGRLELQRVFRGNAMECFALGAGGRGRDRVLRHLGFEPAWLRE